MRARYGYMNDGSASLYNDVGVDGGYGNLYGIGGRFRNAYNGIKEQLRHQVVEKPYKAWSNIFGGLAFIGNLLTAGLFVPALFTGAVAWGMTRSIGYGADRINAGIRSGMKTMQAYKTLAAAA